MSQLSTQAQTEDCCCTTAPLSEGLEKVVVLKGRAVDGASGHPLLCKGKWPEIIQLDSQVGMIGLVCWLRVWKQKDYKIRDKAIWKGQVDELIGLCMKGEDLTACEHPSKAIRHERNTK